MKKLMVRKIKEAIRLQASGLSTRKIAASLGVGHSTATACSNTSGTKL